MALQVPGLSLQPQHSGRLSQQDLLQLSETRSLGKNYRRRVCSSAQRSWVQFSRGAAGCAEVAPETRKPQSFPGPSMRPTRLPTGPPPLTLQVQRCVSVSLSYPPNPIAQSCSFFPGAGVAPASSCHLRASPFCALRVTGMAVAMPGSAPRGLVLLHLRSLWVVVQRLSSTCKVLD